MSEQPSPEPLHPGYRKDARFRQGAVPERRKRAHLALLRGPSTEATFYKQFSVDLAQSKPDSGHDWYDVYVEHFPDPNWPTHLLLWTDHHSVVLDYRCLECCVGTPWDGVPYTAPTEENAP